MFLLFIMSSLIKFSCILLLILGHISSVYGYVNRRVSSPVSLVHTYKQESFINTAMIGKREMSQFSLLSSAVPSGSSANIIASTAVINRQPSLSTSKIWVGAFAIAPLLLLFEYGSALIPILSNPLSLIFLAAYVPCLVWGLPWTKIGSWKSIRSYWHRIGGVGTLILPLFFAMYERITKNHVSTPLYLFTQGMIWINVIMGTLLIPSRIPAYDIPTLRAFAVGVLLALSFSSMSLFYRFGALQQYEIIGKMLALVASYGVVYAWSDALQHVYRYLRGEYKSEIGKKWYLPFEKPSLRYVFFTCLTKQPTKEAMEATVSPSNIVTVSTTFLTAIFATIAMLQSRYLVSGAQGMQMMTQLYPDVVRWSCYEALLAVVANNFGTFAGTLVLQNRVPQPIAGMFNAMGLFIPVLHVLSFILTTNNAIPQLVTTSIGKLF